MNELRIINQNGQLLADSRDIAEMTDKRHDNLVRDIDSYKAVLDQTSDLRADLFFIESSYAAGTGKMYKNYLLTKSGCDMVANKMTGEKGILFTATYVMRFKEMEFQLSQPSIPKTYSEALRLAADLTDKNEQITADNERLSLITTEQDKKLKEQEAPVAIYNLAISAKNTMSMLEVAKALGMGRNKLYEFLRKEGVIMKNSTLPYQRFLDAGYFKVAERPRASGETIINDPATRVYAKGFDYIARLVKKSA